MTVTCPGCGWSAEVPEEKIPDGGVTATCRKCQAKFEVKKELKPVAQQPVASSPPAAIETKPCPLCGEEILAVAVKCKHCGSMLDEINKEAAQNVQTVSEDVEPTLTEPETKEAEHSKPTPTYERIPLSNLEKFLIVIFGLAVVGGISSNNATSLVMLL